MTERLTTEQALSMTTPQLCRMITGDDQREYARKNGWEFLEGDGPNGGDSWRSPDGDRVTDDYWDNTAECKDTGHIFNGGTKVVRSETRSRAIDILRTVGKLENSQ